MQDLEQQLARWRAANLIDEATVDRIRSLEKTQEKPAGTNSQVLVALLLGGLLLGAGVTLFLEAHWKDTSPIALMGLVVSVLIILHLAGIVITSRFRELATVLHGIGTLAAGGVAMIGQILYVQDHWPTAILVWSLCAAAGWYWLRDDFQRACFLLLFPVWLICEWDFRATVFHGNGVYFFRMIAVLAIVYLTAFVHSRRKLLFGIFFTISSVALIVSILILSEGWNSGYMANFSMPLSLRIAAILLMLFVIAFGVVVERKTLLPSLAILSLSFALPWLHVSEFVDRRTGHLVNDHLGIIGYFAIAAVAILLAGWGVRQHSKTIVNYAVIAFALNVIGFCSSDITAEISRSFGLILLGVLMLGGGWMLERVRRRLIARLSSEVSA